MKLIAITPPATAPDEPDRIAACLDAGFDYVHLRKSEDSADAMRRRLDALSVELVRRIKLHSHFELANEYPVAGIHLNSRCGRVPSGLPEGVKVSRSCHSVAELSTCSQMEYATLSPIFDSISKPGYKAAFNLEEISETIRGYGNVVALGGVTADCLPKLREAGFAGAAFMGYIFGAQDIRKALNYVTIYHKCSYSR